MKKRRVLFVSLGCPKNQVDGELMLAKLQNAGFENADNFERLDAVIVNTCAFIDSAKQEAIDTILEMVGLKKTDSSARSLSPDARRALSRRDTSGDSRG